MVTDNIRLTEQESGKTYRQSGVPNYHHLSAALGNDGTGSLTR